VAEASQQLTYHQSPHRNCSLANSAAQYATGATPRPQLSAELQHWLIDEGFAADDPHGALPNGMTPLMRAARAADPARVDELLAAGVDPLKSNADGNQALWLACVGENLDIVNRLIDAGCPIDHQNDNGATCLMYASSTGKAAAVERRWRTGPTPISSHRTTTPHWIWLPG